MKIINIAKGLSLPIDVVTQVVAILAKRRAGKSYTMRRITEQLLGAGEQVVMVDPKGDQWGIRSSADGKKPGYSVLILGGEHGDLPLEVSGGELVARLVVEQRVSVLLDLSQFRKHEVATFMTAFLENLYRLKAKEQYRTPVMLVVDEADAIAPQKPQKGEERMLGAIEDIVRRGGQRGIGCMLVTQRSAVLNKNVLTQAQMLVVLRTIAPQDIAAMKAWIDVHGTDEEGKTLISSLPSLPIGDAWFWSPGWPDEDGIFKRVHVSPITTFDSGATPKPGQKRIVPKNLADVDLDALKEQMAATIEKAKQEDPKLLRKRIAELEAEAKKTKPAAPVDTGVIERAVAAAVAKYKAAFGRERAEWQKLVDKFISRLNDIDTMLIKPVGNIPTPAELPGEVWTEAETKKAGWVKPKIDAPIRGLRPDVIVHDEVADQGSMGPGEKKILAAIAQHDEGITREHLSVLTGYKTTSRNEYTRKLKARGYVDFSGDKLVATQEGIEALGGDYEPLPTGAALQEHVLKTLPEGERKILAYMLECGEREIEREEISEATNYKTTSRNEYLRRLIARKLVVVAGKSTVKVSDKLY